MRVVIVGMGPWGLCVLERLLARVRAEGRHLSIDVVNPSPPGPGVHAQSTPDYLLMNTVCGQISLFGASVLGAGRGASGPSLFEWARDRSYRMANEDCVRCTSTGRELSPHDFLPRRVLGEYLAWVYETLVGSCPAGVTVTLHRTEAVDVRRQPDESEQVELLDGRTLAADHVVLTTGHTRGVRRGGDPQPIDPYSLSGDDDVIQPGDRVAIAGMGLVAVDALTALTIGRDGRYVASRGEPKKRYIASGREPTIVLYSRTGLPFCCRPAVSGDSTGSYRPVVFTSDRIAELRRAKSSGSTALDFRREVMPLLWDEMTIAYYRQCAFMASGSEGAASTERELAASREPRRFRERVATYAAVYGAFDPETLFFEPALGAACDGPEYQEKIRAYVERDVDESSKGEAGSPRKAALELLRVLRDAMRSAVDYGGLAPMSFVEFHERIVPLVNRAIIGPPLRRGQELLALIEAGVVRISLGGAPSVTFDDDVKHWTLRSTRLDRPHVETVDHVVAGHLDPVSLERSTSPLFLRLQSAGRLRPFFGGGATGQGIDVDRQHHPIGADGIGAERLWMLGPATDGVRYFNHYIPSPRSRARAFYDADRCVEGMLREPQ